MKTAHLCLAVFACALGLPVAASAADAPDLAQMTLVQARPGPTFAPATAAGTRDREPRDLIRRLIALQRGGGDWATLARGAGIEVDGTRLLLEIRLRPGQPREVGPLLARELGLRIRAQNVPTLIDAWVPAAALAALAARSEVAQVRPARRAVPLGGGVTTEGLDASGLTPYHALGADGTGTIVALIDGGFDGWSTLQGTDDWPSGVQLRRFVVVGSTVSECPGPAACSNFDAAGNGTHGTSTVEIAYDLAPGAVFWIYQTTYISEWYAALDHASDTANHAGLRADVISASLGAPLDGIGDGTACPPTWGSPCGTIAEASELARSRGSLVVNAAGNEREDHWGGLYNGTGASPGAGYADSHTWPSGSNLNRSPYCLPSGYPIGISAHWDDWSGWPTYDYDLRLYVQDKKGNWDFVADSTYSQTGTAGETPQEYLSFTSTAGAASQDCGTSGKNYALMVARKTATPSASPRNLQIFTNIGIYSLLDQVHASSLGFPADSPAVFTVAALDAFNGFDDQSYFSSEGPVLAPGGGLGATSIPKPDGANFSWVSTQTDGAGGPPTSGFSGTSSATPHVAGIAAVLAQMRLEKDIQTASNPAEALHKGLARVGLDGDNDLGTAGHDTDFGYGRIRLRACSEALSISASAWHMVGLPCDGRAGNTVSGAFGGFGFGTYGTDWGMWAWNPATSAYQMLASGDALALGEGYWLYSVNAGSGTHTGLVPDLTESWAMPATGAAGLGRAHLLANPRRFTLDWDAVRYYYDGAEHDFATAYADGKVRSLMWQWNPVAGDYDEFNGLLAEGSIGPGEALWLKVLADVEVRFPTTATPGSLSLLPAAGRMAATATVASPAVPAPGWTMAISLEAPDGSRPSVRLGQDPQASDGFDGFDAERFAAPSTRRFALVFPRPDLGPHAADYVRDYRAPARAEEWRMEVRSQGSGSAILRWVAPPDVLARGTLVDTATGKSYPLASLGGAYALQLEPGVRELRWRFQNSGRRLTP